MTACRQLLAALLVVVYLTVSTFGMAFVICFEGDGSQNLETVGADCCVSVSSLPAGDWGFAWFMLDGGTVVDSDIILAKVTK